MIGALCPQRLDEILRRTTLLSCNAEEAQTLTATDSIADALRALPTRTRAPLIVVRDGHGDVICWRMASHATWLGSTPAPSIPTVPRRPYRRAAGGTEPRPDARRGGTPCQCRGGNRGQPAWPGHAPVGSEIDALLAAQANA
nr:hypothetical protein [Salinicola tamaricis]